MRLGRQQARYDFAQFGEFLLDDVPDEAKIDAEVLVGENVAQPGNALSRQGGRGGFELLDAVIPDGLSDAVRWFPGCE